MKCRVPMCPRHMGCNQPDRQRDGRRLDGFLNAYLTQLATGELKK
ncbi:MAG: hypothetical protein V8R21_01280 [Dysosmobacter sp.]